MLRNVVAETMSIPIISNTSVGEEDKGEDSATYLFELLVAARRLAVTRRHRFLAYLIGMAAEEARLLTQGRSSVRQQKVA